MKTILLLLLAGLPFMRIAQTPEYKTSSYMTEEAKAPNNHYIGEAWLNSILQVDISFDYNITKATFGANSNLDWHMHDSVQVLIIVDGEAYYQERGKEAVILKKGM